jgi:hypothetical protein
MDNKIQNYISSKTGYDTAVHLFIKNGFTEVYSETFKHYYMFNNNGKLLFKPTTEKLHLFCKNGIVAIMESYNETYINMCKFYFELLNENNNSSSTKYLDICVNFPHECFTLKAYDEKRHLPLDFNMANSTVLHKDYETKGFKHKLPDWFKKEYKIN